MSDILNKLKMVAVKMALPMFAELGKEELKTVLRNLATQKPKKFNILVQSFYPSLKGILVPFVHSTKTELDDVAADPFVEAIEEVATEFKIPLPEVTPVDFTTPDDEEETV